MKILVIGSKGFIGSACYSYFKHQPGYEVYGADVMVEYDDLNIIVNGSKEKNRLKLHL